VRYDMDAAEVWFLWEDPDDPRAIVVELGSDGDAAAEAFSRGSAVAGDPALN